MNTTSQPKITCDPATGRVVSFNLYGEELLDNSASGNGELLLNGAPFAMRAVPHDSAGARPPETSVRMRGEKFINQYTGMGLVMTRVIGTRPKLPFNAIGVQYGLQRETAELSYECPGPGGPVLEAPMHVDTMTLLNWNWKFWGEDTRMIYPNAYSMGPDQENGHMGYEHDTPENAKKFLGHIFRRHYPGGLVLNGAVFYNIKTGHWVAITCRRPNIGYIVNIDSAGRGICFDFTFHAELPLGTTFRMPEITIYHGETHDEMQRWMADYATFYYPEPPAWTYNVLWGEGVAWNNEPTWSQQADVWEKKLDDGQCNAIWISLVTERSMLCGTSPHGYAPDTRHGSREEFKRMCQRISGRGVPMIIWMSHSGLVPGALDVDDDWFIRGIDGRMVASWGNTDANSMFFINPGHPGYVEYTKKWIDFYIKECGCKGIFFDCSGHPIPPDFTPRSFMRYPGETAVHAVTFMDEMYAHIKSCDSEAIIVGEGTAMDMPLEMFSVIANTQRGIDGYGPRDFLMSLRNHGGKKITADGAIRLAPVSGHCVANEKPGWEEHNRYILNLLKEKGGRDTFTWLPGDLSVMDNMLFVPVPHGKPDDFSFPQINLGEKYSNVIELREEITGKVITNGKDGKFSNVPPGFYRMVQY
jgi:hypothetical protein